jgi:hypothetical protein
MAAAPLLVLCAVALSSCNESGGPTTADAGPPEAELLPLPENPHLVVSPAAVVFGGYRTLKVFKSPLRVVNTGGQDLVLSHLEWSGNDCFGLEVGPKAYGGGDVPWGVVEFEEAIVVEPLSFAEFVVTFEPPYFGTFAARLTLYSDDPELGEGVEVMVWGGESVPVIGADPAVIAFGALKPGESDTLTTMIFNLGFAPLAIYKIFCQQDRSDCFTLDLDPWFLTPTSEDPLEVPIGGAFLVHVTYAPEEPSRGSETGSPVSDFATIVIHSGDPNVPTFKIPVSGSCAAR